LSRLIATAAVFVATAGTAWAQPREAPKVAEKPAAEIAEPAEPATPAAPVEDAAGEVIELEDRAPPGSSHAVDAEALERFEHDDIHKVLTAIPGVYIREEDGYGLRPNIGMRGTGSERSAKIALMEDDVLIAPAPYSAPAAYYFPLITRMQRVEVVKGPAAIKHGPNTVGGALNLTTRPIPAEREIYLDVAGGGDLYGKGHVVYGDRAAGFGWLVEGVELRSSGFKELDGGGDTGFDKQDIMAKLRWNTDTRSTHYHQLDLKLGYGREVSNETYTGLTDADFAANPQRRYAGTQLDLMEWDHLQGQLTYYGSFDTAVAVTGLVYRHHFARDWRKLNRFGFNDRPLRDVLAAPDAGINQVLYAVLTGQADSSSPGETLMIGTNSRAFVSQGAQLIARTQRTWLGWNHQLELGTRLHWDQADRLHTEDGYLMQSGDLQPDGGERLVLLDALSDTLAWATHYHHTARFADVAISAGVRGELITTNFRDRMGAADAIGNDYFVVIPGGGVTYQPHPSLGLLAGVHRGFAPVAPGGPTGANPEDSINYEAGARYGNVGVTGELIGFFSDYRNLLGMCTASSGCSGNMIDDQFNGGAVHAYGAEVLVGSTPRVAAFELPLQLTYTVQRSTFQTEFDSTNPQWGDVEAGDEIPYLPRHQLAARAGVAHERFELSLGGRYASAMRDIAGQGDVDPGELTDASLVLDLAASVRFTSWGQAYLTMTNLLDEDHIASRRPFGARPGAPRLVILGCKLRL
jgi:Fe(3+) dicitrate transport protein